MNKQLEEMIRTTEAILNSRHILDKDISKVLTVAGQLHPYKVYGKHETYCEYNQGWSDAVDFIASMLGVEY